MISRLHGTLIEKERHHCIIDIQGLGYAVAISMNTYNALPDPGQHCLLMIHTYVREDQITLYGFSDPRERILFIRFIHISGIGPKVALALLSGSNVDELASIIQSGDSAALAKTPGIGKKTAERIIIELKDKIAKDIIFSDTQHAQSQRPDINDAISALINLGYARKSVEIALQNIPQETSMPIEDMIRYGLRELSQS